MMLVKRLVETKKNDYQPIVNYFVFYPSHLNVLKVIVGRLL